MYPFSMPFVSPAFRAYEDLRKVYAILLLAMGIPRWYARSFKL